MGRPKLTLQRIEPPGRLQNAIWEDQWRAREQVQKPFGWPTDVISKDAGIQFGEMARVDPSNGEVAITLPSIAMREQLGGFAAVANVSSSENNILIRPADADATIASALVVTMSWAYGLVVFTALDWTPNGRLWVPANVTMGVWP